MLDPQAQALIDLIAERGLPPTHTLSPPQPGQRTCRTTSAAESEALERRVAIVTLPAQSRAQRQLEGTILVANVQAVVLLMAHQANGDHQPVAADFGYQQQLVLQ